MLQMLQQLQQQNPSQFKQLTSDIASRLKGNAAARYSVSWFDPGFMREDRANVTARIDHDMGSGQKIEAAQRNLGWNQQPAFLDTSTPGQPHSLLEPTPLDTAVLSAAEKTQALSLEPSDADAATPLVSVNQSVFRVLGALENRPVVNTPALPTITNPIPR